MADISMDFDTRSKLAVATIEKMYGNNLRTLEVLRNDIKKEYSRKGFTAKNIYGNVTFEQIADEARSKKYCTDEPTLIEKCYSRQFDMELLKNLCRLKAIACDDKFMQKAEIASSLWSIIQLKVIPAEVAWAMQLANQSKDVEYTERHKQVYNYISQACQTYLDKTQSYANVLNRYREEKKLNI